MRTILVLGSAVACTLATTSAFAQSALPSYPLVTCPSAAVVKKVAAVGTTTATPSADFTNIQQAINAVASAGGGVVSLTSTGTYQIKSTVPLVMLSNVTLCAPSGATLKYVGTTSGQLIAAGRIYNDTPANNIAILNITFDNGVVLLKGDRNRIERNTFQNVTQFAASNTAVWGGLGADGLRFAAPVAMARQRVGAWSLPGLVRPR
jgi:polygalacturonase